VQNDVDCALAALALAANAAQSLECPSVPLMRTLVLIPRCACLSSSQAKILCTDQLAGTTPRSSPVNPPEPLAFHKAVSPLALRQRMLSSPVPLKSDDRVTVSVSVGLPTSSIVTTLGGTKWTRVWGKGMA
jgi:hypothetical protein